MSLLPDRTSDTRPLARSWGRLALLTAVVVAAVCAAAAWLAPQVRARQAWRAAHEALEDRDFDSACDHLERCLAVWPNDAATNFELARTLRRAGRFEDAAPRRERAEGLGWPHRAVELERLLAQAQIGHIQPLEEGLGALGYGPDDDRLIREALVQGHLQAHFLDRAYRVTAKWVEDRPDDWQGHFWNARVLAHGLQFDLAADAYERALALRPGHRETQRSRGEVLVRRGRFTEAAPLFESCLQADPGDAAARLGLARCFQALRPAAEVRALLQPLLTETAPPAVCLLAGQLAQDMDQPEEALRWLRRSTSLAPHDRDANQALAVTLRRLNRPDEARVFEDKVAAITADYKRMDQITAAVTQRPGNADLRCEAGTILLRRGDPDGAARWLLSALALDPGHTQTRRALAECLPLLGDPRLTNSCRRLLADPRPKE